MTAVHWYMQTMHGIMHACHAHKYMNVEVDVHEAVGPYNHCALDPFWVVVHSHYIHGTSQRSRKK